MTGCDQRVACPCWTRRAAPTTPAYIRSCCANDPRVLPPWRAKGRNDMHYIDDPRKWRLSQTGFSIKTGWADEKKIIAAYPGLVSPLNPNSFQEWMDNAQRICDLHNAALDATEEVPESGEEKL